MPITNPAALAPWFRWNQYDVSLLGPITAIALQGNFNRVGFIAWCDSAGPIYLGLYGTLTGVGMINVPAANGGGSLPLTMYFHDVGPMVGATWYWANAQASTIAMHIIEILYTPPS